MTPKEKQLAARLKEQQGRSNSALTRRKGYFPQSDGKMAPSQILSWAFQAHLDSLLNLSASGKKANKDWLEMKRKLVEAGHWKKSYNK